jgi:hypothetical protein
MTKKVRKVKIRPEKKVPVQSPDNQAEIPPSASDEPFDFGGIPSRDLKKNLGCG